MKLCFVSCHVMVIVQYGMVDIYEGIYPVMVVRYEGVCYQVMPDIFECVCDILGCHVCDVISVCRRTDFVK